MNLLVPSRPAADGLLVRVDPRSAGWSYVGFEAWRLSSGETVERETGNTEQCMVVLCGTCHVTAPGIEWTDVGRRDSPFNGAPAAAYFPPGTRFTVAAVTELEFAVGSAPARGGETPALIEPDSVNAFARGAGTTQREIRNILMEDRPAEALLVTEVVTPGGHWSSYPPHKHDTDDPPREAYLEETYYHRLSSRDGFGVQRVYTDDRGLDETLTVRDGDVVLVPRGYHPVAAAAGYDLYYLNVMAGPVRRWLVRNDPAHEWLLG